MSNYRRLISYIYAYEGGVKGKNIGFAKIETRGTQLKITVSVKKVYVGGNDIGVYLLARDAEIYLGNIFIRNGSGEFRTVVSVSDVQHSGIDAEQCYGLTVHDVKNTWRSYTTIWEDAVAHAAEVDLAAAALKPVEHDGVSISEAAIKRAVKEIEEEFPLPPLKPDQAVAHREEEEEEAHCRQNEALAEAGTEAEESLFADGPVIGNRAEQQETPRTFNRTLEQTSAESAGPGPLDMELEQPVGTLMKIDVSQYIQKDGDREQSPDSESSSAEMQVFSEPLRESEYEEEEYSEERGKQLAEEEPPEGNEHRIEIKIEESIHEEATEGNRQPGFQAEQKSQEAMEPQTKAAAIEAMKQEGYEFPIADRTICYRADAVLQGDRNLGNPAVLQTSAEVRPSQQNGISGEGQQKGSSIKLTDPQELERLSRLEEEEEGSHERVWERLKREHTRILAFDYEKGCEILTIKPQDIGLLPREEWVYGNNSFLLHGYYNYRYLILARLHNPQGIPRYLLGVPGHYYSNERYMASMFGFPSFVLSKEQPVGDGRFGYWYTDVRLGD